MVAEVGQAAPDFNLYDSDRQQRKLSDYKGQNVVLAFFTGAFTGTCTTEMCTFRDRLDAFNSMYAQVFGISVDGAFAQKAWSDANNLNFPLLSDFNREAVNAYGITLPGFAGMEGYVASQRAVFVIDKDGIIRYTWVGETPAFEPDYDEVQSQVNQLPK